MLLNDDLARELTENLIMDEEALKLYLSRADAKGTPLYAELTNAKAVDGETLYRALAKMLGVPYRFYQPAELDLGFIDKFSRAKIAELRATPIAIEDGKLTVLTADPLIYDEARCFSYDNGMEIALCLTSPEQMSSIIEYIMNRGIQSDLISSYKKKNAAINAADAAIDAPAIRLCDSIIRDAINRGASDIHIEPFASEIIIRFRIDGKLTVSNRIAADMYPPLLARYKIMSGLNITERRVPQDGKIRLDIDGCKYDLRVSTIPTLYGEKLEIRIYNLNFIGDDIEKLGFTPEQVLTVKNVITRPRGMILLTGPTGSGKSTTLYTFLRYLNREDANIITVEDPVENEIPGINQVQVNPRANLTFAVALRAILRQDPNIIMVGEIRDEETAQMATRAAITGRLVLSTIHTGDAVGAVLRLINMGIPRYLVAECLLCSISQRLVRKLCVKCKKEGEVTDCEAAILRVPPKTKIYRPCGCNYCGGTGYVGRTGAFEVVFLTAEMRTEIINDGCTGERLSAIAAKNTPSVLDCVRELVLNGVTSFEEYQSLIETDDGVLSF